MKYYQELIQHMDRSMRAHPRSTVVMDSVSFTVIARGGNTTKLTRRMLNSNCQMYVLPNASTFSRTPSNQILFAAYRQKLLPVHTAAQVISGWHAQSCACADSVAKSLHSDAALVCPRLHRAGCFAPPCLLTPTGHNFKMTGANQTSRRRGMKVTDSNDRASGNSQHWFAATHWSVVLAAGQESPERRIAALESLCRTYWEPLYAYLRFLGHDTHGAQDLVQAFFAHLLSGDRLQGLGPEKGKFRSFLLASLNHFVADDRDRTNAAKRGGGQMMVSLDEQSAEAHFVADYSTSQKPEALFDRRWAMTTVNRAFLALQNEFLAAGKAAQFLELSVFLATEGGAADYSAVGTKLGLAPGAVAVAVHRLRHRYRECIRAEVAQTVAAPQDVDDEMRYLLEVLCQ